MHLILSVGQAVKIYCSPFGQLRFFYPQETHFSADFLQEQINV